MNIVLQKAADWWNLGVIIYEMIYSIPPFYSDDDSEMEDMITNNELQFPNEPQISDVLKDLITKLLNKNYEVKMVLKKSNNMNFSKILTLMSY